MGEQLAVRGAVEKCAHILKHIGQLLGIHYVAIVGESEIAVFVTEVEGLNVVQSSASVGGVAHVAYAHRALQLTQLVCIEDVRNQSQTLAAVEFAVSVHADYAATLLTPVLQGVQAVVEQRGGVCDVIYSENAAFLVKSVLYFCHCYSSFELK